MIENTTKPIDVYRYCPVLRIICDAVTAPIIPMRLDEKPNNEASESGY